MFGAVSVDRVDELVEARGSVRGMFEGALLLDLVDLAFW